MTLINKEILITGGTGSLGKTLVKMILNCLPSQAPKGIRVFSRDELKQWEMKKKIDPAAPVSFLVGDVRDRKRIELASKNVDIVIHCAALKQVPSCEQNPLEAINTNIIGAQNILYAALENKVEKVLGVSTDKACYPVNLYGATKLAAEKIFIQGNTYSAGRNPRFSCVRYGNVLGSRGSVVPLFKKQFKDTGGVTVTDPNMTRFWTTLNQMASFILECIEKMKGEEIFIPKLGSASITTILEAVIPDINCKISKIGIRPGEKLHEILINKEESLKTKEYGDHFVITNKEIQYAKPFEYRSETNEKQLNYKQIRKMINDNNYPMETK